MHAVTFARASSSLRHDSESIRDERKKGKSEREEGEKERRQDITLERGNEREKYARKILSFSLTLDLLFYYMHSCDPPDYRTSRISSLIHYHSRRSFRSSSTPRESFNTYIRIYVCGLMCMCSYMSFLPRCTRIYARNRQLFFHSLPLFFFTPP